jgi:hypothetical protein
MSPRDLHRKRAEDIRRELLSLDKQWIRVGRVGQRRIETRMHALRAELRQASGRFQGLSLRAALGVA